MTNSFDEPTALSSSLSEVVRALGGPTSSARSLRAVFGDWDEVVGAQVAAHVRPISVDDGVLVVMVDQPGWATQLRFLEADLMARLNEAAGATVVSSVQVRVEGQRPRRGR
jgi:predicted nucleic acid-binding Zn ribbon protein